MIATPLGKAFVKRATAILNDVRRAREEVEQLRGNTVGELTVGLLDCCTLVAFAKSARAFPAAVSPMFICTLLRAFIRRLSNDLQNGTVDFYVGPDPGQRLPRALRKDTLFPGRRAVLCRLKHPLARATSLKELVDAEWITTSITPQGGKGTRRAF